VEMALLLLSPVKLSLFIINSVCVVIIVSISIIIICFVCVLAVLNGVLCVCVCMYVCIYVCMCLQPPVKYYPGAQDIVDVSDMEMRRTLLSLASWTN